MKKLIFLDDKAKKLVISVTILAFVGVIAMSMFMGCTGEEADRSKKETGRIMDTTDAPVPCAMMSNPFPQVGKNPVLIPLQRPGRMVPRHIIELPYGSGSTGIFENACWNGCA